MENSRIEALRGTYEWIARRPPESRSGFEDDIKFAFDLFLESKASLASAIEERDRLKSEVAKYAKLAGEWQLTCEARYEQKLVVRAERDAAIERAEVAERALKLACKCYDADGADLAVIEEWTMMARVEAERDGK